MKVLLVTENLGSGGAERQLVGLAIALRDRGHEPIVVTWFNKNFHKKTLESNNIHHILLTPKNKAHRIKLLASLFKRLKPDAVISFLPMANESVSIASLLAPVNLIVSERSFTTKWGVRRKLTNLIYRRAKYIVANSNNEAENIRSHCRALSRKVTVIPNYVDVNRFAPINKSIPKTLSKISFIGVGRVIPTKNLLNLLNALYIVKKQGVKFSFDWYGDTYDIDYYKAVNKLIDDLQLVEDFRLNGECHDIEKAYQKADIMCFPSLLEGYPNVLVEAMACGLPIVASAVCENPFIVKDNINGFLFDPNDVDSIANAIFKSTRLSNSEYSVISAENRSKVLTNNSIDSFVQRYLNLL